MNNSSYKILIKFNEKLINKVINKYSKPENNISITGMAQCLYELKIFRELLKIDKKDKKEIKNKRNIINNDSYLKELTLIKLRNILKDIKEGGRKEEELEFLEQIWFVLNPNQKEYINKDIFEGFLKLLYSYSEKLNSKKEIMSCIKDYLNIIHFMEPKNNNENGYQYISPIRNIIIDKIWPIEKIIKIFIKLKKNLIAYESDYLKKSNLNNTVKDTEKENIFKTKNKRNKNEKYNFDKLYKSFMDKKLIKEKTLEKIREIQEKEKLSKLQKKPKIINYKANGGFINPNEKMSVHEKLYERRKDKDKAVSKIKEKYALDEKNKEKEKEEIEKKEDEKIKYIPPKTDEDNHIIYFSKTVNPKGTQSYIKRNRAKIKQKEEERKKEEDLYTGKNYEKIRGMNIKPPKIKDIEEYNNKLYNINNKQDNYYCEKMEKSDDEDFDIDIKIPNGKIIKLKFNINDDIYQKAEEFCKIFSLNDSLKQKLIKKFEEYKNDYKKHQEEEEEDEESEYE